MVVGPLLGAGVGLAQAILQSGAQRDSRNLSYLSLFEQKRQAMEQERLAKADRGDAYGNTVRYIPGIGFRTDVTPLTRAILNSQQKEQLAQFRDDAPRQRAAAERIDSRSRQAGEVYDDKFNEYRYGREKTEAEYVAEAIRDAIDARRGGGKVAKGTEAVSRAALRTGNRGALRGIVDAASKIQSGEETLAEAIARAKKEGRQQFLVEGNARNSTTFGELGQLRSIADAFVPANLNFDNENDALSGRADSALGNLIATNAASSRNVASAYGQAASAAGQFPDLGGIGSSLSRLNFGGGAKEPAASAEEQMLAKLLLEQKIGSARIGIGQNNNTLAELYKGNTGRF